MKRIALLAVILAPALAAASVPIEAPRETAAEALARVAGEAKAAEAQVAVLTKREAAATDEAARLRAARARAAADIALTEVRIARADIELGAARQAVAERAAQLDQRRAPLAALLAGLATMGRRPPILALADSGSIRDMVRVRALVDSSMPVIAARSASLKAALSDGQRLAATAERARRSVAAARAELLDQTKRFAALETQASARAAALRADASRADDQVLAGGEQMLDLGGQAAAAAQARQAARPRRRHAARPAPPLCARRPRQAAGDRLCLADPRPGRRRLRHGQRIGRACARRRASPRPRGSAIVAPAEGTILFAGPYRDHDGIIVIEHGGGWTSLLIDVAPGVARGDRVAAGAPLGKALGDVGLELRRGGPAALARSHRRFISFAVAIAPSSAKMARHIARRKIVHDASPSSFPRWRWSARWRWCR